ncbi:hypothetical protein DDB_G0292882 [Dictyostelium discoideum AX4]|uniref:30S ribosomal protein S9 n=1 Tax=Dictyostelium discoideum TaxID=44689 RepID=Q54CK4_DICDI|nr:hypothetical protein DDB_G0292882 [Dictyostelium discoideum AX4]EAL60990.1 hypothetical protein DDB_G0292882 [Dictyostelium discoideum AX4]|eukprot:XP_629412.1 hypothetical protein DDB_G0292882 [Dictyostelium discoideum AX4]
MLKLVLNNTINSVASKNTSSISNGLLKEFSKLSIYKNNNNKKINNCKCTNCVCNCKCTKKTNTTTNTNIYNNMNNNNKRYYSTKQNIENEKQIEEDSKIGLATSDTNRGKLLEDYYDGSKSRQDYFKKFRDETTPNKQDPADNFRVRVSVPRPEFDEHYEKQLLPDDFADSYLNSIRPNSNREQEELPFSDNTRFSPFRPVRPKIQKTSVIDGASSGYSKRKRSRAVVSIQPGNGSILINGRTLLDYFPSISYRDNVVQPLVITETLTKWDVSIRAFGGGLKGQSEAARRALGFSLVNYDLGYRPALKIAGLLKNDIRKVERKKPGLLKARKRFPLVKR